MQCGQPPKILKLQRVRCLDQKVSNIFLYHQVKVAIYTNGEEQANIVFDVRNLGRNDWFQPENVISSTFNDLSTDPNQFNIAR